MSLLDKIKTQIQSLINTANENTGNTDATLTAAVESLIDGYGGGGNDYLKYVTNVQFSNMNLFGKEDVELEFDALTGLASTFQAKTKNVTVKHLTLTVKQPITNMNATFYATPPNYDETLKRITLNADTSQATYFSTTFSQLLALEIIDGTPLDLSSANSNSSSQFNTCKALKEVRFVKNSVKTSLNFINSSLLSVESIQSIIDGLADLTGLETQTLTLHADVKTKLTEEQISQITYKNWTLA